MTVSKGKTHTEIYGEELSLALRKNLSIKMKNRVFTESHKKKLSDAHLQIKGEIHPSWKGGKSSLVCKWCNLPYEIFPYRTGTSNFCSRKCQIAHKKQNLLGFPLCPPIGKDEKTVLDYLEMCFNYPILRQYKIGRCFVDGYCPTFNLVIEVDEPHHQFRKDRDLVREQYLQSIIDCKILRISTS